MPRDIWEEQRRIGEFRMMTKQQMLDIYFDTARKHNKVMERLSSLVKRGICKPGALLAYDSSDLRNKIHHEMDKDALLRRTTRLEFAVLLEMFESQYLRAKEFVEEKEANTHGGSL